VSGWILDGPSPGGKAAPEETNPFIDFIGGGLKYHKLMRNGVENEHHDKDVGEMNSGKQK
jgi:hypothetical protein